MIDLTLNEILIPHITGYVNPYNFGTIVPETITNQGGLSSREVNHNILAPFDKMRAAPTITGDNSTSNVEYDAKLIIDAEDSIEFSLGNATYTGCKITIVNKNNLIHTLLCTSVTQQNNDKLMPNTETELMWNGTAWQNMSAPAIGKRVVQYPTEKSPLIIYPCTDWQEISYNGAFFRTKGGLAATFVEYGQNLPLPQPQGTAQYQVNGNNNISFSGTASNFDSTDPQWEISYTDSNHTHKMMEGVGYSTSGYQDYRYFTRLYSASTVIQSITKKIYAEDETVTISGTISGNHNHTFTARGTIKAPQNSETRPVNYTIKVWERIA